MSPTSHPLHETFLSQAIYFAKLGGDVLKSYWESPAEIEEKGFSDLVTQADKASEKVILGALKLVYPDHAILAEESGQHVNESTPYTWVIDPLDGTTNYAHKYPHVSVSIGLLYEEEPIVGVIFNPIRDELFYAAKGSGAFYNQQKIHVSSVNFLSKSLLATGFAYDRRETPDTNYPEFSALTHQSQGVRRGGSAALDLAYVAAGKFEAYWERGVKAWDIAAGIVIVREAGGKVTGYDGTEVQIGQGELLASNGKVHEELSSELMRLRAKRLSLPPSAFTLEAILSP